MNPSLIAQSIKSYDERRNIAIPGDQEATLHFCAEHFYETVQQSLKNQNYFAVALAGGSTPKAIYERIAAHPKRLTIDWTRILLFWSDERNVPPNHSDSNYAMALKAGFDSLNIPQENIFRMQAETDIEENAKVYENLILNKIPSQKFDLVLLGIGEDGHTASLFPYTHGLHANKRLVIANFIPEKNIWRMSLTFECINAAKQSCVYVLGSNKAEILQRLLNGPFNPDLLPAQLVGTLKHPALWIADADASAKLRLL
jgi:6-phosphogluconolactonase